LTSCSESWTNSGCIFDLPGKTTRLAALETAAATPEFWGDPEKAQKGLKEQSDLRQTLTQHASLVKELEDHRVLLELAADQEDVETRANRFKKMIFQGDHLVGAMMLNVPVDPGVMLYLIRNKVPLGALAPILFEQPREISRLLMMEEERKGTVVAEEEQKLWAERQ